MKNYAAAFLNFQRELTPVTKDSENPFFKNTYSNLSTILQAVTPILNKNDLAVSQPMRIDGDKIILSTKITHSSGEFDVSEIILPHNQNPQQLGSLITYYKRYQLQAMLGVSTKEDDDDANIASGGAHVPNKHQAPTTPVLDVEKLKKQVYAISKSKGITAPEFKTAQEAKAWVDLQNKK